MVLQRIRPGADKVSGRARTIPRPDSRGQGRAYARALSVAEYRLEREVERPRYPEGDLQRRRIFAVLDSDDGLARDADPVG